MQATVIFGLQNSTEELAWGEYRHCGFGSFAFPFGGKQAKVVTKKLNYWRTSVVKSEIEER